MHILSTPIEYLKGVGPIRAELLKSELNIFTYEDLITHYPFRYIDRSKIYKIKNLSNQMSYIQIRGKILKIQEKGVNKNKRLIAQFQDDTGVIELIWFKGIRWVKGSLKTNTEYIAFGKPSLFQNQYNIVHPELDISESKINSSHSFLQPVYSATEKLTTKGLHSRGILKLTKTLIPLLVSHIEESLSNSLIKKLNLFKKIDALNNIHFPKNSQDLRKAIFRIKFEEFFFLQLHLLKIKSIRSRKYKGYSFKKIGTNFNNFFNDHLTFSLTSAQREFSKRFD